MDILKKYNGQATKQKRKRDEARRYLIQMGRRIAQDTAIEIFKDLDGISWEEKNLHPDVVFIVIHEDDWKDIKEKYKVKT